MTKTDREIELEKKLSIAVKALKEYADEECWEDTYVGKKIQDKITLGTKKAACAVMDI